MSNVVENGVQLHGVDGEDAGGGARGVGRRARARRGAALRRLPHARARHHIPDDRPELAGTPPFASTGVYTPSLSLPKLKIAYCYNNKK